MTQSGSDRRKARGGWVRCAGWLLAVVGLILLIFWGVRVIRTGISLRARLAQLQAMADKPSLVNPAVACELAHGLRTDIVALKHDIGGLVNLAPLLGGLPRVGGDLRAAPHLLTIAEGLSEVGEVTCQGLRPLLSTLGGHASQEQKLSLHDALRVVTQNQATWQVAITAATRAEDAWRQVDAAAFSPTLARKLALLDRGLPLLRQGFSALTVAPQLLGMDRPRTYLVLALNEDELRPGGGFITGVGEIRVQAGNVITMTFRDSYAVDDFTQPYPDPPEPMRRFMGLDLLVLRDSNWSPDFPTAARQAAALYRPGYPVEVDGVIAMDQRAVQGLVEALAPLSIGADSETVTGETIIPFIRRAWAPEGGKLTTEWSKQRKSFMGPLAAAVWQRIEQGQVNWSKLIQTVLGLVEGKHLLAYFSNPVAEAVLAAQGWDGSLQPGPGDFLAIIDANLGYNKTNARIRQAGIYQVDLRTAQPQASLVLTYTHTASGNYPCLPEIEWNPVYDQMMDRCYWDYLRVYVPQGSQLLAATRIPVPADATWDKLGASGEVIERPAPEGPWLSLEVLSLLPPTTTQTRSFTMTLPSDVVQWQGDVGQYMLRLVKQPGAAPYPMIVRVHPPDRGTVLDASPDPSRLDDDGWLEYRLTLDRDQTIRLHWKRAE